MPSTSYAKIARVRHEPRAPGLARPTVLSVPCWSFGPTSFGHFDDVGPKIPWSEAFCSGPLWSLLQRASPLPRPLQKDERNWSFGPTSFDHFDDVGPKIPWSEAFCSGPP